ncbi:hypothetical protein ACJ72_08787, partial [Emergomyces africanus]
MHVRTLMQRYMNRNEVALAKSTFIKHTNEMNEGIRRENTRRGQVEYLHILDPDYLFSGLEAITAKYHDGDMEGYENMRIKMLAEIEEADLPQSWCPEPWNNDTPMDVDPPASPAVPPPASLA